jgi:N-methylhydantoinase A
MTTATHRIGIDVGGTFTDFVVADTRGEAATTSFKLPSTSAQPSLAVLQGLERIVREHLAPGHIAAIVHGTTIGLNSIVQRTGAAVGLVVTRGFRDVMQLTQRLPEEYNLRQPHLQSLVGRENILEIGARLDAHGTVLARPTQEELDRTAEELRRRGVTAVAVSVLHGYADPAFEKAIASELASRLEGTSVSSAAAIRPQIREYERTALATLNAYVAPLMHRYLTELQAGISSLGIAAPLFVTTSAGGCIGVESALERPVETLLSGPASGVMATALLARKTGENLISLDMGGTSTDISVIVDAKAAYETRSEVGGIPLITPVVDVNAIGTGGGSIIWVDGQDKLRVGPRSAGAVPGPIVFGRGGEELTLTDVYLLAGILSPAAFEYRFGTLRLEQAETEAIRIAGRLGYAGTDPIAFVAANVLELSTALAASELQKMLARHGYTAGQFSIAPFGGAGPVAGALLAEDVGAREVVIPLNAGTFCALGAAWSDIRRELVRGVGRPLTEAAAQLGPLVAQLHDEAVHWARRQVEGVDPDAQIECRTSISARYRGQAYALDVPLLPAAFPLSGEDLAHRFHAVHTDEFGYRDAGSPIEVIAVRALVTVPAAGTPTLAARPADGRPAATESIRRMLVRDSRRTVPALGLADVQPGTSLAGPAVLDLPDSTILIPDGWSGSISDGAVRLARSAGATPTATQEFEEVNA